MTSHARVTAGSRECVLEYEWISRERSALRRCSCSCTKGSARSRCGGTARGSCATAGGFAASCIRARLRPLDAAPAGGKMAGRLHASQAHEVLPALLQARRVDTATDRPWLFGHSDGASIALLHAAAFPDRVAGVIAVAPHVFVEDLSVESIARTRETYLATTDTQGPGLRIKLGRYHDDPDSAFWGWNDIWLDPAFRSWNIEAR